jgi:3-methyladenine DNA glycosylase AlkD
LQTDVLDAVRSELSQSAAQKMRDSAQRFFKEEAKFYGVKSAAVKKIAQKYKRDIKGLEKPKIFALCENLLQSGYGEEAAIAFEWAYSLRKGFQPTDFQVFESWVEKYVDNWAKCDTLCNHTIGAFIEQYPSFIENLRIWATSQNRWLRRASAVTLIVPAKRGDFLNEALEISEILLKDQDDLVQKGYGWLLKEASRKHQKEIFEYVMSRKAEMPRTALRYAIEKMPEELRKKAMER